MATPQDIQHQRQLLAIHRGNIAKLSNQISYYGGPTSAPLHMLNNIEDTRAEVARIKALLRGWGETVPDEPGDTAAPSQSSPRTTAQPTSGASNIASSNTVGGNLSQNTTFHQPGWNVRGDVYNIAGSLNLGAYPARSDMLAALRQLTIEVAKAADLPAAHRDDIGEDIDSAVKALERAEPNRERAVQRLQSAKQTLNTLHGVAPSVQPLGKLIDEALAALPSL